MFGKYHTTHYMEDVAVPIHSFEYYSLPAQTPVLSMYQNGNLDSATPVEYETLVAYFAEPTLGRCVPHYHPTPESAAFCYFRYALRVGSEFVANVQQLGFGNRPKE